MLPFPIISNTDIRESKYYKKIVTSRVNLAILNSDSTDRVSAIGDSARFGLGVPFTYFIETINDVQDIWSTSSWSFVLKNDGSYWWSGSSNPFTGVSTSNNWSNLSYKFNVFGTLKKAFTTSGGIVVLNTLNEVWVCGGNQYGSYGNGNTTSFRDFTKLNLTDVKDIFGHDTLVDNIFILYNDGTLVGSGYNGQNLLGTTAEPTTNTSFITISTDVVDVKVTQYALFIKKTDGSWYAQGSNYSGQMGNGVSSGSTDLIPITLPDSTPIKDIYAGSGVTHIISTDNRLFFAGYSSSTYPLSGASNTSSPWNANVLTFTEVTGSDPEIISGITDILHFGTSLTYFVTRYRMYGCGNGGSYQLIPPYGSGAVIGFKLVNTPSLS